jgi:hypothetical protein
MRFWITAALTTLAAGSAVAGEASISIEIPRLSVSEYHKPYVAFWVESADGSKISTLAVWFDAKQKDNEGTKYLKDMRQWWRRVGRELTLPADGLSSPTRGPGTHQIFFDSAAKPLSDFAPGSYQLVVEAAREVGGRELLRVPFQWPPPAPSSADAKGDDEITSVTLKLTP